ncbi:MAG: MFS transporter [Pseudonocardiaceae bacterium]
MATALGSGMAFLDGTVVNIALPAIGRDLGGGIATLQWVLDGYFLTLSALLLLGGAVGDRYGRRRVFQWGLVLFTLASLGCGLAPSGAVLISARSVQGVGGAMPVPGSLALIDASIRRDDRGRAVGTWAGLSGVAAALGPFVGGWLVDAVSWQWVFFINVPLAVAALLITTRHVPESRDDAVSGHLDFTGAAAVTVGWRTQIGRPAPKDGGPRALLIYARCQVEDLADAGGWEAEFDRDVWQMRRLGFTGNQWLTFTRIPRPWLRDLVKRWLRWRLGTGLGLPVASRGLLALTRFAVFCQRIDITALAGIDRSLIERYLADLHAELAGRQRHGDHIGQLNMFLHAIRQHHWDDSLPRWCSPTTSPDAPSAPHGH